MVNFGGLLFLLWYFLYEPILKLLDERREKIAKGVKDAEEAAEKLASSHTEGKAIVGKAAKEAEGLLSEARVRADEKGAELVKAAQSRADAVLADANARAEEARRQALLSSEKEIAKAAMLAAEKILRSKTS
jgi:F-type H+-transporting ATPase subunit b